MLFHKRRKSAPRFNPHLGKAIIDVQVLGELTRVQILKWQMVYENGEKEIEALKSLVMSVNTCISSLELSRDGVGLFKDINSVALKAKQHVMDEVQRVIKSLQKVSENVVKPLKWKLQQYKESQKKKKSGRKLKDGVGSTLARLESEALEKQLYQDLDQARTVIKSAISSSIFSYGQAVMNHYKNSEKSFKPYEPIANKEKKIVEALSKDTKALYSNFSEKSKSDTKGEIFMTKTFQYPNPPPEPKKYTGEGLILKVDKVSHVLQNHHTIGILFATNYRLVFLPYGPVAYKEGNCPWYAETKARVGVGMGGLSWFEVPWLSVAKMEKALKDNTLTLHCKDLVSHTVDFTHAQMELSTVSQSLETLLWPPSKDKEDDVPELTKFFAYWHRMGEKKAAVPQLSWLNWQKEYHRLGIPDRKCWVVYHNAKFALSKTYPNHIITPQSMYSEQIQMVADFRSKKRFPVLCWRLRPSQMGHFKRKICLKVGEEAKLIAGNDKPFTFPSRTPCMLRCSQPHSGLTKRCQVEEDMFNWIGKNTCPYDNVKTIAVMDCRPKINAMANVCKGGGWESLENYKCATLDFLNIGNIHVVRDSLASLHKAFARLGAPRASEGSRYRPIREALNSGKESWLEHISSIMNGANIVVSHMTVKYMSVVIHCSDGWDRTPQVTAISQLQMDPFYRTLIGFSRLVEKEFVGFGHMFAKRTGHGITRLNSTDQNRSPIFLQFLDVVHQLVHQFPQSFEFNKAFLVRLIDMQHSGLYGNFLCDTEEQRSRMEVRKKTKSLWPVLLSDKRYINKNYTGIKKDDVVLVSCIQPTELRIFEEFFIRWDPYVSSRRIEVPLGPRIASEPAVVEIKDGEWKPKLPPRRKSNILNPFRIFSIKKKKIVNNTATTKVPSRVNRRNATLERPKLKSKASKGTESVSSSEPQLPKISQKLTENRQTPAPRSKMASPPPRPAMMKPKRPARPKPKMTSSLSSLHDASSDIESPLSDKPRPPRPSRRKIPTKLDSKKKPMSPLLAKWEKRTASADDSESVGSSTSGGGTWKRPIKVKKSHSSRKLATSAENKSAAGSIRKKFTGVRGIRSTTS